MSRRARKAKAALTLVLGLPRLLVGVVCFAIETAWKDRRDERHGC